MLPVTVVDLDTSKPQTWTGRKRRPVVVLIVLVTIFLLYFAFWEVPDVSAENIRGSNWWPADQVIVPEGGDRNIPFNKPPSSEPSKLWTGRANVVKSAFVDAYEHYMRNAFPKDELRPLTNRSVNNFNGWGVTQIDSLDTIILMDLTDLYETTRRQVAKVDFTKSTSGYAPFFETVIRYLGGLLSAYYLTQDPLYLSRADQLGLSLMPIFNTTTGIPHFSVDPKTGATSRGSSGGGMTLLAEMASCQVEYKYLAHLTGRAEYFTATDNIYNIMQENQLPFGMWAWSWSSKTGTQANENYSMGAMADSAYEYLLKNYLMSGRTETRLLDMYMTAMRSAISNLLFLSPTRQLLYVTDIAHERITGKLEHLSCFFPGLLTLGDYLLPDSVYESPEEKQLFRWAAKGLAHTCYIMYAESPSGMGPEEVRFKSFNGTHFESGRWVDHVAKWKDAGRPGSGPPGVGNLANPDPTLLPDKRDYGYSNRNYLLRPESLESMYLMWRTTGDVIWREHAWEMFSAIHKNAKIDGGGYASRANVDTKEGSFRDEMPSYFLAETLKYPYLTFIDDDPWPLEKVIFNTEAHPLPVFTWSKEEMEDFSIAING